VHCGSVRCVGERAYVDVPFAEKDEAKRCDAVPAGMRRSAGGMPRRDGRPG